MASTGMLLLSLLMSMLVWLLPPWIGFFLPPPRRSPAGIFYWIILTLQLLMLVFLLALYLHETYVTGRSWAWWILGSMVILAPAFGLVANTFWGLGHAKRLPPDLGETERREAFRPLCRRLWLGLCLLPMVTALFSAVSGYLLWEVVSAAKSQAAAVRVKPATAQAPQSPPTPKAP